jgi:hypothetical protein
MHYDVINITRYCYLMLSCDKVYPTVITLSGAYCRSLNRNDMWNLCLPTKCSTNERSTPGVTSQGGSSFLGGFTKQWPIAGEFVEFEYSPKIRQIFVTRSGEFGEYWANFCDSLRRIWRVLSEFGEFGEFGKFGEFGEGRLDRYIHKKIFFLYIKRPSLKIR